MILAVSIVIVLMIMDEFLRMPLWMIFTISFMSTYLIVWRGLG